MKADQVRALVAAKWPHALQSPLAVACATFAAADEADRAVQGAALHASATAAHKRTVTAQATEHAWNCTDTRSGWDVETLGHNLQSNFGDELSEDECDDIARAALNAGGAK